MKELTATFNTLLQDKRVRFEQSRYENITRQRSAVMSRYKRVYQEFLDLEAGLQDAKQWYSEMKAMKAVQQRLHLDLIDRSTMYPWVE